MKMKISRERILLERLGMARHNLLCYSKNYLCTVPNEGMEDQYKETVAEIKILEAWLKEFHSTHTDSTREFVGYINSFYTAQAVDKEPLALSVEFKVETGDDYLGDVRVFYIGQEVQNWFVGSYNKYDREKDHRESRVLKITVDKIECIRSIEWAIKEDVDQKQIA